MSWVENTYGLKLTGFQKRAVELLCRGCGCGPYDLGNTFKNAQWNFGRGVRFTVEARRFATTDAGGLTTLVLGAHEESIRVEILPCNFKLLAIEMHPRQREGKLHERHPTIEDSVRMYRQHFGVAPATAEASS